MRRLLARLTARARPLVAVALALACLSCGGGGSSPAAPTAAAASVELVVRDGWDNRPVGGAVLSIGNGSFTSQSDGHVSVGVTPGTALRVDAGGFLRRETAYRGKPELDLWSTSVNNLDYIFALGYNLSPGVKLARPDLGAAQVVISDEMRRDPATLAAVQAAVADINLATGGALTLSLDAPASVSFRLSVDAVKANQALGVTYNQYRGSVIAGADIYLASMQEARSVTVLHELGHAIGLGHSVDPRDVMFATLAYRTDLSFTDPERRVITMMWKRLPGNAFPDNDQGVALSAARAPLIVVRIVCPR